jgi:PKD repeat protein
MRTANAALTGGSVFALLLAVGLSTATTQPVLAQAGTQGQWRTLTNQVPINPVHVALLRTGQVLIVAGSGNVATETNFQAAVWDPATETFQTRSLGWDMFCNGMVTLHDGRVLINGGNLKYDPFWGEPRNAVFDPITGLFTDVQNMLHGRWYPTVTTLGDGRVMTFSGLRETGGTNSAAEIYTVGSGWSQEFPAGWTPPLYPRMHLSTDGRVFYAGSTRSSRFFDPSNGTWTPIVATTNHGVSRTYGTSVMLPLTPANGYRPRVMILGGGNPGTATTEIIDLSAATPQWQFGPSMSQPRIQLNATLLPNGKVLATGGSRDDESAVTASLNGDLYDPVTNTFSLAGANAFPRLYHSNALLLPDATVLLSGGNPQRGNYERRLEVYSPAYLFNGDGSPASRPAITGLTADAVGYGASFQVQTPNAADIASVVLIRPGTPTHAFDMDQRFIGLSFTAGSGLLNVTAPPNGNIAPPGYYMLFVLNNAGVPSVARFVRISPSVPNQAPVASITSPGSSVTVNPGGTVSFAGSGTDADGTISGYAWTFPGGAPGSSSVAAPGSVSYATPGTYVASLTVTDDKGLASQPATRTVTVSNFSLSATPSSQAVTAGQSASYTATVTPSAGFTGTVNFSVTGLPSGATPTFTPPSVAGSGSTSLVVSTSAATPAGTYPLVISGTSGSITRTANVTLVVNVVNGDFAISATPASRTISRGGSTTYTVTVAAEPGFAGSVNLTASSVPTRTTATFNPASLAGSGTSVLTISTQRNVQKGTRTLTITGTGGGRTHSVNVTLVIQ